jgi:hypothetical protein
MPTHPYHVDQSLDFIFANAVKIVMVIDLYN